MKVNIIMNKTTKEKVTIVSHIFGIMAFLAGVIFLIHQNEFRGEHSTIYVVVLTLAGLAVGVTIHQLWCDVMGCNQYCTSESDESESIKK